RPLVLHESRSKVIEQLGMAGQFSRRTKVIHSAHEAGPQEVVPDAIDDNATCERVLRIGEPLSQFEATALIARYGRGIATVDRLRKSARDRVAGFKDVAFRQQ